MKLKKLVFIFTFVSFLSAALIFSGDSSDNIDHAKFPDNKTCAAWYSRKSMAFTPMVGMTGMNCATNTRFEKSADKFQLVSEIPLIGFDSGSKGRDKFFRKALMESERPALLFQSGSLSRNDWNNVFNGNHKKLSGILHIGKKQFPVDFTLTKSGSSLKGIFVGNYGHFEMKPHVIAFGLIAKTEDYLELHFHLDTSSLIF